MISFENSNLEDLILKKLAIRSPESTICPSEILNHDEKQNEELMKKVRFAAKRLHDKGLIDFYQKGQKIDPDNFKGPIRLKLKRK